MRRKQNGEKEQKRRQKSRMVFGKATEKEHLRSCGSRTRDEPGGTVLHLRSGFIE